MDKILALVAFAFFCGFLGILWFEVPRLDLGAVIAFTILCCGYDLLTNMRRRRR